MTFKSDYYDTTDPALWPNTDAIVRQYLTYKERANQLRRELRITNRMVRDAEEAMRRASDTPREYLTWSE